MLSPVLVRMRPPCQRAANATMGAIRRLGGGEPTAPGSVDDFRTIRRSPIGDGKSTPEEM